MNSLAVSGWSAIAKASQRSPDAVTSSAVARRAGAAVAAAVAVAVAVAGRRTSRRNPMTPPANAIAAITVHAALVGREHLRRRPRRAEHRDQHRDADREPDLAEHVDDRRAGRKRRRGERGGGGGHHRRQGQADADAGQQQAAEHVADVVGPQPRRERHPGHARREDRRPGRDHDARAEPRDQRGRRRGTRTAAP